MSQENITNNQEGAGIAQAPKPFDKNDTKRIEELEAKYNPEGVVGHVEGGPSFSDQFEGSKIFTFIKDGVPVMYAIRRNDSGELEGNSFRLQRKERSASGENWVNSSIGIHNLNTNSQNSSEYRITTTYRMTEQELNAAEKILGNKI